jgi:hypothetical protein
LRPDFCSRTPGNEKVKNQKVPDFLDTFWIFRKNVTFCSFFRLILRQKTSKIVFFYKILRKKRGQKSRFGPFLHWKMTKMTIFEVFLC